MLCNLCYMAFFMVKEVKKLKNCIYKIFIIIFIFFFIISTTYIIKNKRQDKKQNEIFKELENIIADEPIEENKQEQKEEKINLQNLYNINNDFIGWLKIEDTNISYPIMQTNRDRKDYYLKRNFYKQYSELGTPYIAEYCNVLTSDNVIIYGHHINKHRMFGELEKYKNKEFYNNHKIINFNSIYENANYEIIAVFKTIAYTGFNYYKFEKASTKNEFDTFIKKCIKLSFYETENIAEYGDKLLTLSTCEYSNKNGRLVIVAKKITTELEE